MVKPYTNCYRTPVGKVLAKLRVEYGETVPNQAKRLGYAANYISLVSAGKRGFSSELYKRIFECYGEKAQEYRELLTTEVIKPDVKARFEETFGHVTVEQMVYVLFGTRV